MQLIDSVNYIQFLKMCLYFYLFLKPHSWGKKYKINKPKLKTNRLKKTIRFKYVYEFVLGEGQIIFH